jgi:hypothetical protein
MRPERGWAGGRAKKALGRQERWIDGRMEGGREGEMVGGRAHHYNTLEGGR